MKSPFGRGETVYVSNYQVVANSTSNHRRQAKIWPNGFNLVVGSNWQNPKKSSHQMFPGAHFSVKTESHQTQTRKFVSHVFTRVHMSVE